MKSYRHRAASWGRRLLLILGLAGLLALPAPAQAAPPLPSGLAPLPGEVVREFDPPEQRWNAGHRGVDLAGTAGEVVVAAVGGVVRFAGPVAGRGVVSLAHGDYVTTYEPLTPLVRTGEVVELGQPIGYLEAGHACTRPVCLHWGLKLGETYLNPLDLLPKRDVYLIAPTKWDELQRRWEEWRRARESLQWPVRGPVTSPYGWRVNPVTGAWSFHSGTDIGVPCRTPIKAPVAGVITQQGYNSVGGNNLRLNNSFAGRRLETGYYHLSAFALTVGTSVNQGDVIGYVGTTGQSTGCHLHFTVWVNGATTDPLPLLP